VWKAVVDVDATWPCDVSVVAGVSLTDDVFTELEAVELDVASASDGDWRCFGTFLFLTGFVNENTVGTASGLTSFRDH